MAIMLSVNPFWTGRILDKDKIIELRKTCPKEWKEYLEGKTEKPKEQDVYIYCTKSGRPLVYGQENACVSEHYTQTFNYSLKDAEKIWGVLNGKVVAKFKLKKVEVLKSIHERRDGATYQYHEIPEGILYKLDLTEEFILDYSNGKDLYLWYIDELEIYEEPKELNEFSTILHRMKGKQSRYTSHLLQRPPQSWCYVEYIGE